jgi:hypothetical protein
VRLGATPGVGLEGALRHGRPRRGGRRLSVAFACYAVGSNGAWSGRSRATRPGA